MDKNNQLVHAPVEQKGMNNVDLFEDKYFGKKRHQHSSQNALESKGSWRQYYYRRTNKFKFVPTYNNKLNRNSKGVSKVYSIIGRKRCSHEIGTTLRNSHIHGKSKILRNAPVPPYPQPPYPQPHAPSSATPLGIQTKTKLAGKAPNHIVFAKNTPPSLSDNAVVVPVEVPAEQIEVIPVRRPKSYFYSFEHGSDNEDDAQNIECKDANIKRFNIASHTNKRDGDCDVTSTSSLDTRALLALSMGDVINRHEYCNSTIDKDKCKFQEEKTMEREYSEFVTDNALDNGDKESRGNVLNIVRANKILQAVKLTANEETWANFHNVLVKFWLRNKFINTSRKHVVREINHTNIKDLSVLQVWDTILKLLGGRVDLINMLEELVESQKVDAITTN